MGVTASSPAETNIGRSDLYDGIFNTLKINPYEVISYRRVIRFINHDYQVRNIESTIIDIADQDHWSITKRVYTAQTEFELYGETVI